MQRRQCEITPERTNRRNGYRPRTLDTRVGTIDLVVPKLRQGSYYPAWLLQPRRRAERALVAYLGIEHLSKSQVSRMAKELNGEVAAFRGRPLENGPYTYEGVSISVQLMS